MQRLFILFLLFLALFHPTAEAKPNNIHIKVINPRYNAGMFSIFNTVIGTLDKFDKGLYSGCTVSLDSGMYLDPKVGPNWWEYFFYPINLGSGRVVIQEAPDAAQLSITALNKMPRERAHELIKKYVQLKPFITDKVDHFINTHFKEGYIIGVHYRGTDKSTGLSYRSVFNRIRAKIASLDEADRARCRIFVASDEQAFVDQAKKEFLLPVICYSSVRSTDGQATHKKYYTNANYQKAEDALMDCLLLSRCTILYRMHSNLSACSTMFNPKMPEFVLK